MLACLLLDARDYFLSDFILNFSYSPRLASLLFCFFLQCFFLATFFHCNQAAPSAASAHFIPVSSLSLSTTKHTALCGLDSKSSTTFICENVPLSCALCNDVIMRFFSSAHLLSLLIFARGRFFRSHYMHQHSFGTRDSFQNLLDLMVGVTRDQPAGVWIGFACFRTASKQGFIPRSPAF